jgi:Dihydrodipicolinate synthetase family.
LFMAPNPVPVKAALQKRGLISEFVRKPLIELTEEQKTELFDTMTSTEASLMALL